MPTGQGQLQLPHEIYGPIEVVQPLISSAALLVTVVLVSLLAALLLYLWKRRKDRRRSQIAQDPLQEMIQRLDAGVSDPEGLDQSLSQQDLQQLYQDWDHIFLGLQSYAQKHQMPWPEMIKVSFTLFGDAEGFSDRVRRICYAGVTCSQQQVISDRRWLRHLAQKVQEHRQDPLRQQQGGKG